MAGHILSVLKLAYGLNDKSYSIEVKKINKSLFSEETLSQMHENTDDLTNFLMKLPSLYSLFIS